MQHLEDKLQELILTREKPARINRSNSSRALKHFPIEPRVKFLFNNKSYTTMEVIAQDQPGLLHNVALILRNHNMILLSARIATFGERAEDVFYIRHADHTPVNDSDVLASLEEQIIEALDKRSSLEKTA